MAAVISQRPFTRSDSDRLAMIAGVAEKLMVKNHLTRLDLLTALRYLTRRNEVWEEELERAKEFCVSYETFHELESDAILKKYGDY